MWSVNLTFTTKMLSASPIGKSQNCSSHSIALGLVNFVAILMQLVMSIQIYTSILLHHNECDINNWRHRCEVHLWALHMLCQCPVSVISCAHAIFALIFLHSHYYRISTVFFLDPISISFLKIKSRSSHNFNLLGGILPLVYWPKCFPIIRLVLPTLMSIKYR